MLTLKVKKRASLLTLILILTVFAVFLILKSLSDNILYFKSPTDIKTSEDLIFNKKIRVGGMVKKNSVSMSSDQVSFVITDFKNEVNVKFSGVIPNLFSEDKGVVAEGFLRDRNFLNASKILAKHDENYMPPEVKEALKDK